MQNEKKTHHHHATTEHHLHLSSRLSPELAGGGVEGKRVSLLTSTFRDSFHTSLHLPL
jgi:hypothetical protein